MQPTGNSPLIYYYGDFLVCPFKYLRFQRIFKNHIHKRTPFKQDIEIETCETK